MRIDAHVHVWPPAAAVEAEADVVASGVNRALLETLKTSGIDRAILVQPSVCGLDHAYLLSTLEAHPARVIGIAQVEPEDDGSFEVIEELTRLERFAGFRVPLLRASERWMDHWGERYWRLADSRGCPITVLMAPKDLDQMHELARAYPRVPIVVDHMARLDLASDRTSAAADLCSLASSPNVYVKWSALAFISDDVWPYRSLWPILLDVLDAFGAMRLMWGSDYPFCLKHGHYDESLAALALMLRECGLSDLEPEIFGAAARRVFFSRDVGQ